jgi:hypothetical protein
MSRDDRKVMRGWIRRGDVQGHETDSESFEDGVPEDPPLRRTDGRFVSVVSSVETTVPQTKTDPEHPLSASKFSPFEE